MGIFASVQSFSLFACHTVVLLRRSTKSLFFCFPIIVRMWFSGMSCCVISCFLLGLCYHFVLIHICGKLSRVSLTSVSFLPFCFFKSKSIHLALCHIFPSLRVSQFFSLKNCPPQMLKHRRRHLKSQRCNHQHLLQTHHHHQQQQQYLHQHHQQQQQQHQVLCHHRLLCLQSHH